MNAADPFSFKEIQAIEKFDLVKPEFLKASDGVSLAYYSFVQPSTKKIVIFYAGAGLYGNSIYQWVAKTLHDNYDIGCYIFDLRGHGHSQGPRGDAPSINRVWHDVAEAVEFVKIKHQNVQVYLAGHSSGAGLIINYAAHREEKLEEGYIFLAPYLGPKSNTAYEHQDEHKSFVKSMRMWVYILGAFFPNSFIAHFKALFFNYPDTVLQSDPLIVAAYTYAMSCATKPYEIDFLLKKLDKPVALFIGEDDEQFLPEKIIAYKDLMTCSVHAEIIKNAGHLSILLQAPQLIAQALDQ